MLATERICRSKYMQKINSTHTDSQLVQSFLQGDAQALETLINKYKDKIYTAIFMLVKDKYVAEDIFQDTFLKIIRNLRAGRYSEQGKFLPWAMRVAHNLCMDYFRKVRINLPVTLEDGREIGNLFPNICDTPVSKLEEAQVHRNIRALVDQLPQEQKDVVILRIYGELSFKEIAEMTSVSINTALGRMRYGLINLRKMIEEKQMVLR